MFFSDVCGETDRTNLSRASCHLRAPRFSGQGSVRSTATRWLQIAQGAGQAGAASVVTGDRQWNYASPRAVSASQPAVPGPADPSEPSA